MYLIALCDDDVRHAQDILRRVEDHFGDGRQSVELFESSRQLLDRIRQGYKPHIALLDICLPDINGIDLARQINRLLPECQIIFITSFLSFAPDAYDAEHLYFILKEQLDQRLTPALHRAVRSLEGRRGYVFLQRDGSVYPVALRDVLYIERALRKTLVATAEGDYTSRQTPAELAAEDGGFVRCHQSYWVNLSRVQCMEASCFVLENGRRVPISRTYRQQAKERFFHSLVEGAY